MKPKIFNWIWIVLLAAGCARSQPVPTIAVQEPVSASKAMELAVAFEKADCPPSRFNSGGQQEVECGFFNVPVDRTQPDGEKIKIAVTIIHATAEKTKPDPVVFVSYGGSTGYSFAFRNLLQDRDLILVDPRGAGRSEPGLTCPQVSEAAGAAIDQPPYAPEVLDKVQAAQQECYQAWQGQGVDLAQYSSAAIAGDLEDLRQALGYERWNVYANGYGARVALLMMRDFPQTLRSVIIESPAALVGEDLAGQAANLDRVLNLFFESCAADEDCNQAFPELKTVFYDVVERLNNAPLLLEVADLTAGKRYQVLVNGDRLIDILIRSLSSGPMALPEMPRAIYQLKGGQYDTLARLLGSMVSSFGYSNSGMQWQVECTELLPQVSREQILQSMGALDARLREYATRQVTASFNTCDMLKDVQPSSDLQQVSASAIPTLILYGDRSPLTSPDWAKRVGSMLSKSTQVEITGGGGFDRNRGSCSRSIASAFLDDPQSQLDTACAAESPAAIPWITLP